MTVITIMGKDKQITDNILKKTVKKLKLKDIYYITESLVRR